MHWGGSCSNLRHGTGERWQKTHEHSQQLDLQTLWVYLRNKASYSSKNCESAINMGSNSAGSVSIPSLEYGCNTGWATQDWTRSCFTGQSGTNKGCDGPPSIQPSWCSARREFGNLGSTKKVGMVQHLKAHSRIRLSLGNRSPFSGKLFSSTESPIKQRMLWQTRFRNQRTTIWIGCYLRPSVSCLTWWLLYSRRSLSTPPTFSVLSLFPSLAPTGSSEFLSGFFFVVFLRH